MNKNKENELLVLLIEWFKDNRENFIKEKFWNRNIIIKFLKGEFKQAGCWRKRRNNNRIKIKEKSIANLKPYVKDSTVNLVDNKTATPLCQTCGKEMIYLTYSCQYRCPNDCW